MSVISWFVTYVYSKISPYITTTVPPLLCCYMSMCSFWLLYLQFWLLCCLPVDSLSCPLYFVVGVSFTKLVWSIRFFFVSSLLELFIMLLSNTIQSSVENMVPPHQFQYGLHALPGMNTVSAFLDVVRTLLWILNLTIDFWNCSRWCLS
jgi:hypothetical protein